MPGDAVAIPQAGIPQAGIPQAGGPGLRPRRVVMGRLPRAVMAKIAAGQAGISVIP
jgi:hypothetical protein